MMNKYQKKKKEKNRSTKKFGIYVEQLRYETSQIWTETRRGGSRTTLETRQSFTDLDGDVEEALNAGRRS